MQAGAGSRRQERGARQVQPASARSPYRAPVSSSTRSMMNRMNSGSTICKPGRPAPARRTANAKPVRPQPPEVLADVLAPLAAQQTRLAVRWRRNRSRAFVEKLPAVRGVGSIVEPAGVIVLDEAPVELTRRSEVAGATIGGAAHRSCAGMRASLSDVQRPAGSDESGYAASGGERAANGAPRQRPAASRPRW